jgi:hypothetical protein
MPQPHRSTMNAKEMDEWFDSHPEDIRLAIYLLGDACEAAVAADKAAARIVECNARQDSPHNAANTTQANLHYGATAMRFAAKMVGAHEAVYNIERHHQCNVGSMRDAYNKRAWEVHARYKHHIVATANIFERRRLYPPITAGGLIINDRAAFLAVAKALAVAGEHHEEPNANDIMEHKKEDDPEPHKPKDETKSEYVYEQEDEAHLQNEHLSSTGQNRGQAMHIEAPPTTRRPSNADTTDEATNLQETAKAKPHKPTD